MKSTRGETIGQAVTMGIMLLAGMACGAALAFSAYNSGLSPSLRLLRMVGMVLGLYLALFLQIALHEGGHLVFGLLTGYRFCSYRIGSLMAVRENGKLVFRRLTLAGTGGQCLMEPPEGPEEATPTTLYHLGGCLMNLLSALVFWLLWRAVRWRAWAPVLLFCALIGLAYALANGIPLRNRMVANDGYNTWILRRRPEARRSIWVQLSMQKRLAAGDRLADLPEDWFILQAPASDPLTATLAVLRCNQLLDQERFAECRGAIEALLSDGTPLLGIHRQLLLCDLICLRLLAGDTQPAARQASQMKKLFRSMARYPSVMRTQYMLALLADRDSKKAAALRASFERQALRYPYPSEMEGERRLMALAEARAAGLAS